MGTYGSRSIAVGGTAIVKALDKIIAKGRKIAAHLLEASEADIEYDRGVFKVTGTDKQKTFGEVAFAACVPHNYPLDKLEPGRTENAGQLVTGSFSDYAIPRAGDVPLFKLDTRETPCTHNPLGVKGCGEAGAIGAPAAVMNAITDALGVKDIPMPATAQTVWRSMHKAA